MNYRRILPIFSCLVSFPLIGMEADPYQDLVKAKKMDTQLLIQIQKEKNDPYIMLRGYAVYLQNFPTHTCEQYIRYRDESEVYLLNELQRTQQNINTLINSIDALDLSIPYKASSQDQLE